MQPNEENGKGPTKQVQDDIDRLFALRLKQNPAPAQVFQDTLAILQQVPSENASQTTSNADFVNAIALPAESIAASTPIVANLANGSRVARHLPAMSEPINLALPPRSRNLPVVLVASLILGILAAALLLLVVALQGEDKTISNPPPVAAITVAPPATTLLSGTRTMREPVGTADYIPNTNLEFLFPTATKLKVLNNISTGAFATSTDWQVVTSYYKQKLPMVGYTVFKDSLNFCGVSGCESFEAGNGSFLLDIQIYSPTSWKNLNSASISQTLAPLVTQLRPDQALIMYSFRNGPLPASVTPNATALVNVTATVAPVANNRLDLSYPGADKLEFDRNYIFQFGSSKELESSTLGAYAVAADDNKILEYYRQKLTRSGYNVAITTNTIGTVCGLGCNARVVEAKATDGSWLKVIVFNQAGMQDLSTGAGNLGKTFAKLYAQIKPGQILIVYEANLNAPAYQATVVAARTAIAAYAPAPAATLFGPVVYSPARVAATSTPTPGPANRFGELTPAVTPTPISANSQAFLGPDKLPHSADDGSGLVATDTSLKIGATEGATYYFDGLTSDAVNGTHLDLTLEFPGSGLSYSPDNVGTLTDEAGHSYLLNLQPNPAGNLQPRNLGGKDSNGKPFVYEAFRLNGPALPAGTRTVVFTPSSGLPFKPTASITLHLKTFSEASLPKLTPLVKAVADIGGIKVELPYAYFGRDRTWLDVVVDATNLGQKILNEDGSYFIQSEITLNDNSQPSPASGPTSAIGPAYSTPAIPTNSNKNSLLDDKGRPLSLLQLNPNQTSFHLSTLQTFDNYLVLKPVATDAKSVTLNIPSLSVFVNWSELHYARISSQAPRFSLPLAQLIRSGKLMPGGTITLPGFVVRIIGVQAVVNQAKGEVTLIIKHQTVPDLTSGKGAATNASVSIVCVTCGPNNFSLSRDTLNDQQVIEDALTFKYDPAQTNIELGINNLIYILNGPWQVTIPVSQP